MEARVKNFERIRECLERSNTSCSPVSKVHSTLWFTRSLLFSQRSKRWMITPGKLHCSNVY